MEKLESIALPAGSIVHFQGMPLMIPNGVTFLGNKNNFEMDISGYIALGAKEENQVSA